MERVTGVGGVFLRARDPETLSEWYERHLGVECPPATYQQRSWTQEGGQQSSHRFPASRRTSFVESSSGRSTSASVTSLRWSPSSAKRRSTSSSMPRPIRTAGSPTWRTPREIPCSFGSRLEPTQSQRRRTGSKHAYPKDPRSCDSGTSGFYGRNHPYAALVEAVRRADLIDVSQGLLRFGLPRSYVKEVRTTFDASVFFRRVVPTGVLRAVRRRQQPGFLRPGNALVRSAHGGADH